MPYRSGYNFTKLIILLVSSCFNSHYFFCKLTYSETSVCLLDLLISLFFCCVQYPFIFIQFRMSLFLSFLTKHTCMTIWLFCSLCTYNSSLPIRPKMRTVLYCILPKMLHLFIYPTILYLFSTPFEGKYSCSHRNVT